MVPREKANAGICGPATMIRHRRRIVKRLCRCPPACTVNETGAKAPQKKGLNMSSDDRIAVLAITEFKDARGNERTRWRKVGLAFENTRENTPGGVGLQHGGSITVHVDAIPLACLSAGSLKLQLRRDDWKGRDDE